MSLFPSSLFKDTVSSEADYPDGDVKDFGTAGESSVTGTTGVATIVGVYGPLRMHFRKASPFGLVSMYHKNRDRHCAYRPVASIGGRSLEPAAIMLLCI
ncbi:hypothetical protein Tco_0751744 [Tanacetum coccineum]|uniref:Uncharacterized protein n=1 Tax=Tanacetum coccineum TaxID=301880 RepID=A0ABQ4Z8F1_9ASTR